MDNPFEAPARAGTGPSALDLDAFVPAGHGARFAANLIDSVLVVVVFYVLAILIGVAIGVISEASGADLPANPDLEQVLTIPLLALIFSLYVLMGLIEGSSWQATPGKRLVGLRVVHASGRDISLGEGVGRQLLKVFLLNLCGLLGLVCLEEPARRGVWDMALSTRVVQRNRYAQHED